MHIVICDCKSKFKKKKNFPFRIHRKTLLNPSKLKKYNLLTKKKKLYSNPLRYEEDLELIIMG